LVSIANFYPGPIPDLAQIAGYTLAPEPGELGEDEDRIAYLASVVGLGEQLVRGLCRLVRDYDLGNMALTLGGQALAHYRHRHLTSDILCGPEPRLRPLEKAAYYGSRQQVYFRGRIDPSDLAWLAPAGPALRGQPRVFADAIYRLDVNQCYPFVMRSHRYPIKPYRCVRSPSVSDVRAYLVHYVGIAAVRIFSPVEPYPVRLKGRTCWRVGSVHTVLAGVELERAVASGHVIGIDEAQFYYADHIFASWADEVMAWRAQATASGDRLSLALLKRISNSLHGKFGQHGRIWQDVPGMDSDGRWGQYTGRLKVNGPIRDLRGIVGRLQVLGLEDTAVGACPAIAACVTAAAREHMRTLRRIAGEQETYYEDADSLHVSARGYAALVGAGALDTTVPGRLKIEAECDSAEYLGPKHYRFGTEWMLAGRAANGVALPDGTYSQEETQRMDTLLAVGMPTEPISSVRPIGDIDSQSDCGYDDSGWVVYRQGGQTHA